MNPFTLAEASENFQLIQVIFGGIVSIVLGILSYLTMRTKQDVQLIEKATNSMHTAIVNLTGDAKKLEGKEEGRAEVKAEIAADKKAN